MIQVEAKGISFGFRPETGLLDGFTVTDQGHDIAPLHRAPWVGTKEVMPPDAAPLMARLGGDFFCAPFAASEAGSPLHGWPANTAWLLENAAAGELRALLGHPVFGSRLSKRLTVRDGHPFVYQCHSFAGGKGRVSAANHANLSLVNGGLIRTSPKRVWETPGVPQEDDPARGRSALVYPAQSSDPRVFPGIEGPVDLTRYPWNPRHEDFVVGIEAPGHDLGWTAVTRPTERDLYLSLRNAARLPMTMLWHSNGGRDYAPWSGRHFGCLGIEEGAADRMLGVSKETDLTGPGALSLTPDAVTEVRHVIGAIFWPSRQAIASIAREGDVLCVTGVEGATRRVPFDARFLGLGQEQA